MTLVSNDPIWWPTIESNRFFSYWIVASSAAVIYDSVLTFGQEVELIWRQRWSLMTILYLSIRYIGILYAAKSSVSLADRPSYIMYSAISWTSVVVIAMLGVIMIARLHAMYQQSRKMLIFLIVIFLAVNIASGVITAIGLSYSSGVEAVLSGTYICTSNSDQNAQLLIAVVWILTTVWEILALCLALWIAVKHFRELRRLSAGQLIGDCFVVLIQSHTIYFASFAAVSFLELGYLSPMIASSLSVGVETYNGLVQIFSVVQMFVLGPRLILGVREYNAKLVADSDTATGMASIVFQERIHVSTSSGSRRTLFVVSSWYLYSKFQVIAAA
ncbi:uncharacterized protein EDB91DRAFT_1289408 [Suillus paluster]|uniref:uncharacterized protein n=1 Tax=Suillus paluster TaxID=48578 RepID=UPI001B86F85D|nr:uncharacterized protein EDB91DRAFT_1289408 [Suillus paluster]KAG1738444.1 hypothetical protein EDB91DRAFT_1289408 [Suillus paluster]